MIIEHDGKEYNIDTWHKSVLEGILKRQLREVIEEIKLHQPKQDLSYGNLLLRLYERERDIRYKIDKLSGRPML